MSADDEMAAFAAELSRQCQAIARRWIPLRDLPAQVVHGDATLDNLPRDDAAQSIVLDLGFSAYRPRVHDLAYTLHWTLLVMGTHAVDHFPLWTREYEDASKAPLDEAERRALPIIAAATALHRPAIAGLAFNPVDDLRGQIGSLELARTWLRQ